MRKRTIATIVLAGIASVSSMGCMAVRDSYLNDSQNASWLTRQIGGNESINNAKYPTGHKEALETTGQSGNDFLHNVARLVDDVPRLVGWNPLERMELYDRGEKEIQNGKDYTWKKVLIHPVRLPTDVVFDAFRVIGSGLETIFGTANTVVCDTLTTAETSEYAERFGNKNPNPEKDNLKYTLDTIATPIHLLRTGFVWIGDASGVVPEGIEYALIGLKKYAGINVLGQDKLINRYKGEDGTTHSGKLAVGHIPLAGGLIYQLSWGDNYLQTPEGRQRVIDTIDKGIPTNIVDHSQWYQPKSNVNRAPGIIVNGIFYPAKTNTGELGKLLPAAISTGSGGGGGQAGGTSGGRTGGAQ